MVATVERPKTMLRDTLVINANGDVSPAQVPTSKAGLGGLTTIARGQAPTTGPDVEKIRKYKLG